MRTFKHSLRELRADRKQREICEKLHIARNTYSQYETGKRQIPIKFIPQIAKALNCSIEDIVLCFCEEESREAL